MELIGNSNLETKHEIINEHYDVHSVVILNNFGRPKYIYIDGDKDEKICRFCGKSEEETTFDNRSHIIPKFLGNFVVLSNFECDECNAFFSRYETELEKYVKIPLISNKNNDQLKDRTGRCLSRINGVIEKIGDQEEVSFNSIDVLKIFLKFGYSLLLDEELDNYTNIKRVLLSDSLPRITSIMDMTLRVPYDFNSTVLYKSKNPDFIDNILVLNFNMKKYVIFFNKDGHKYDMSDDVIRTQYSKLFMDLDIYRENPKIRNFNLNEYIIKFNIDAFMKLIEI